MDLWTTPLSAFAATLTLALLVGALAPLTNKPAVVRARPRRHGRDATTQDAAGAAVQNLRGSR